MLDRQSLLAALAQLPPSQREAIVLCHVADHSTADAAAILGTSPASAPCARGAWRPCAPSSRRLNMSDQHQHQDQITRALGTLALHDAAPVEARVVFRQAARRRLAAGAVTVLALGAVVGTGALAVGHDTNPSRTVAMGLPSGEAVALDRTAWLLTRLDGADVVAAGATLRFDGDRLRLSTDRRDLTARFGVEDGRLVLRELEPGYFGEHSGRADSGVTLAPFAPFSDDDTRPASLHRVGDALTVSGGDSELVLRRVLTSADALEGDWSVVHATIGGQVQPTATLDVRLLPTGLAFGDEYQTLDFDERDEVLRAEPAQPAEPESGPGALAAVRMLTSEGFELVGTANELVLRNDRAVVVLRR